MAKFQLNELTEIVQKNLLQVVQGFSMFFVADIDRMFIPAPTQQLHHDPILDVMGETAACLIHVQFYRLSWSRDALVSILMAFPIFAVFFSEYKCQLKIPHVNTCVI